MFTGLAYDAVMIVKEAIERAGTTDSDEVNSELEKTNKFKGITGTFSFDEKHNRFVNLGSRIICQGIHTESRTMGSAKAGSMVL